MVSLRRPDVLDWELFFSLAETEGWQIPLLERQLFQGPWSEFVRVLDNKGIFCGLVTAVPHERSGWIGNLLVPQRLRGKGYGTRLFQAALESLLRRNLDTVWLTASSAGRPIYEKSAFTAVDRIERWVLPARTMAVVRGNKAAPACGGLAEAERVVWGEDRRVLLDCLLPQGRVLACGGAVALVQLGTDVQICGPWYVQGQDHQANRRLLADLLAVINPVRKTVVDLLASSALQPLLAEAGFALTGENALMARGDLSLVDLRRMVSLASLGSFA